MRTRVRVRAAVGVCAAVAAVAAVTVAGPAGGATTVKPYAVGLAAGGYETLPLLSVGDTVPESGDTGRSYQMVGIPDGLGAYQDQGEGALFMNHELTAPTLSEPVVGGPLNRGAFVSRFELGRRGVVSGERAYDTVHAENGPPMPAAEVGNTTPAFGRFCSGSMAGPEVGFDRQIYLTNEEADAGATFDPRGGSTVAIFDNEAHTLPKLGHFAKENTVVAPGTGSRTVIFSLEDGPSTPDSQLYMYVGRKDPSAASVLTRNGLDNGRLYVFVSTNPAHTSEETFTAGSTKGRWVEIPDAENLTQAELEAASDAVGALGFVRIEDGAFNKTVANQFFFVTTGDASSTHNKLGRLYRLSLNAANPIKQATLEVIYSADRVIAAGGDTALSPDNIDTSSRYLMIQEDGTSASRPVMAAKGRDGSIWRFDLLRNFAATRVAQVNPPGRDNIPVGPGVWESSGIIDASALGHPDSWIFDVQAHPPTTPPGPNVVEDGQLLLMRPARHAGKSPFPLLNREPPPSTVAVQLLAINDFHGNLEPPGSTIAGTPAGGAEYLATHIRQLEATNPNTMVVSAGDLIGASPLLSALFHDEPTIEAMNLIGLDLNAVGNHEFDDGAAELLRMQEGGCHPVDGCVDGDPFAGADFRFLSANVVRSDTGETLFPPYEVRTFQGAKVAFIGMTLEGTPGIVTPSGIAGLEFRDEVETVNALVPELQSQGVESIVVLVHEGGLQSGGIDECAGISGPVADIASGMNDAVDIVVSGHTHQSYNCVIDGKLVTSASSFGRVVTDIDFTVDKASGDVVEARADNLIVTRTVDRAGDVSGLIAKYKAVSGPLESRVIGAVSADLTRTATPAGESALGDFIADAQLAATDGPTEGNAVVAFMNPGGIRADLTYAPVGGEEPGQVTYGEAFTVQPFGNTLVTMTLTGAQLETLLEQQWCNQVFPRILQVSAGFSYTWDASRPACDRIDPSTIRIGGVVVDPVGTYRVTVNSFLADGGDSFTVLRDGTGRLGGPLDLDAFEAYLAANTPVAPGALDRISRVG